MLRALCALYALGLGACSVISEVPGSPSSGPRILGFDEIRPDSVESLTWLGSTTISRTDSGVLQHFGGISGMDVDPVSGTWYLLSDDKSEFAPARLYTATLSLDRTGAPRVTVRGVVPLLQADGSFYPDPTKGGDVPDAEALRIDPFNGELVWSSEGDRRLGLNPWVRRSDANGHLLGEWTLPRNLALHRSLELGARHNLSLEGLAFAPDGGSLWMAMEAPLYQDGPVPDSSHGAAVRFTRVARGGSVLGQYAYPVGNVPVAGTAGLHRSDNGVSEILALGNGSLLVVERAGHEVGDRLFDFTIRIYQASADRATDVAGVASLAQVAFTPMSKRLIVDLNSAVSGHVDNIEAAAWGPRLADGRRTLVLASDDNFASNQVNQFLVFAVNER